MVPVVLSNNQFVPIGDEIPYPEQRDDEKSFSHALICRFKEIGKSVFRITRTILARLIPLQPVRKFLYSSPMEWGVGRILLLMKSLIKRPVSRLNGINIQNGDVLILLDSSWHLNLWKAVDDCKKKGASIVVVVYDLIPKHYPQFCVDGLVLVYNKWFEDAISRADIVVAISQTLAKQLKYEMVKTLPALASMPRITYFWLGSELDGEMLISKGVSPAVFQICASKRPIYLYVSTIEPRKNHKYALEAFERLWNQEIDANFVIVGRLGWKCKEFVNRVKAHPQFARKLFMFNNVEDHELAYLYDHARALIFTSLDEGFGLPVVEGLKRGLPVFASDIPVFREIGKSGVSFVDLGNPDSLAQKIALHIEQGAPKLPEPIDWLSWEQSTDQLYERIKECLLGNEPQIYEMPESAMN